MPDIPKVNILGVPVAAIDMPTARAVISESISAGTQHIICIANTHTVMQTQHDSAFRAIYEQALLITPDGMPLVWLAHLYGHPQAGRVYGPDLMWEVCASQAYRHFFYGGSETILDRLCMNLRRQFPALQIVGTYAPPFRPLTSDENHAVAATINAARPDIVWVGLGAPKQEYWMAALRDQLTAPLLIGVGAAFDFHAGIKRQSPRFLQQMGLEWAFRLVTEPRRLWRRYLFTIPPFVVLSLAQFLRLKRFPDRP
jgi:N-acetylglucosaminyldiphosphoundecaprenol N-acetyl-beta-D-mannosaminyltransferase